MLVLTSKALWFKKTKALWFENQKLYDLNSKGCQLTALTLKIRYRFTAAVHPK